MTDAQFEKAVHAMVEEASMAARELSDYKAAWHARYRGEYHMVATLFGQHEAGKVREEVERRCKLRDIEVTAAY